MNIVLHHTTISIIYDKVCTLMYETYQLSKQIFEANALGARHFLTTVHISAENQHTASWKQGMPCS